MIENAEKYRAAAKARREAGGSTARVYSSWQALDRARGGNVGPGTWEHCLSEARANWQNAVSEAKAQFDWDARLGFEMKGGTDEIPF